MQAFRAAIWKQNNWFIAQCVEIDIATQGGSEREALDNIKEAIALHLDISDDALQVVPDSHWLIMLPSIDPPRLTAEESKVPVGPPSEQFTAPIAETSFLSVRYELERQGFDGICQRPHHAKFIKTKADGELLTAILPHYAELSGYVVANIFRQARLHI